MLLLQMSSKTTKSKATSAASTRSATDIWLVGKPLCSIDEPSQLPVSGVALRRIYYEIKSNKASLAAACSTVADEVMSFWVNANISMTAKPHVVAKLKLLHKKHVKVSKHKERQSSASQMQLETDFTLTMNQLFDIAHAAWERRTPIHEDRQFLIDQRGPRQMGMTTEDISYRQAVAKYHQRKENEHHRYERYKAQSSTAAASAVVLTSSDDSAIAQLRVSSLDQSPSTTLKRQLPELTTPLVKRCVIDNPVFNAALDRTRTTTRQAMMIVTPALAAAGVDVSQLTLSRASLMDARNNSRETLAAAVRQNFQPSVPLVAHFDGKLLPNFDGGKRVLQDCMPVVVSGFGVEKLLGIPKLPVGTGTLMGQKVVEFVREWPGVEEHLSGLCFDTTSSNTGIHAGAITVVQQSFSRRLLFLACRHHMLEITASAVFDIFFMSKGPEIDLFGRFKS